MQMLSEKKSHFWTQISKITRATDGEKKEMENRGSEVDTQRAEGGGERDRWTQTEIERL